MILAAPTDSRYPVLLDAGENVEQSKIRVRLANLVPVTVLVDELEVRGWLREHVRRAQATAGVDVGATSDIERATKADRLPEGAVDQDPIKPADIGLPWDLSNRLVIGCE